MVKTTPIHHTPTLLEGRCGKLTRHNLTRWRSQDSLGQLYVESNPRAKIDGLKFVMIGGLGLKIEGRSFSLEASLTPINRRSISHSRII
ncbi:hypothetical protein Tco_1027083 [Tanacetum coccineum]